MNLYILLVIGIILYFVNEWANLKYLNNKIRQAKNELIKEINKYQIHNKDGTKIQK